MNIREGLNQARHVLTNNDVDDASIEGELLLRQALNLNRVQLYQSLEQELSPKQQDALQLLIERRLKGEPAAYINGHREFYGLDFYVNKDVFIPRPETEHLVDRLLNLAHKHRALLIADIGTGCGAIAVSLAINLPQSRIYATDISAPALKVAHLNCHKHGMADRVHLLIGDMLSPLPQPVDFIAANLPYIRQSEIGNKCFEPIVALDGGDDGLERIRRLCQQIPGRLHPGGSLILEIGYGQGKAVTDLLNNLFPNASIEVTPDLAGIDRVVSMALPH